MRERPACQPQSPARQESPQVLVGCGSWELLPSELHLQHWRLREHVGEGAVFHTAQATGSFRKPRTTLPSPHTLITPEALQLHKPRQGLGSGELCLWPALLASLPEGLGRLEVHPGRVLASSPMMLPEAHT